MDSEDILVQVQDGARTGPTQFYKAVQPASCVLCGRGFYIRHEDGAIKAQELGHDVSKAVLLQDQRIFDDWPWTPPIVCESWLMLDWKAGNILHRRQVCPSYHAMRFI